MYSNKVKIELRACVHQNVWVSDLNLRFTYFVICRRNIFYIFLLIQQPGLYASRRAIDYNTLFKLTIVKFFGFKAEIRSKIPDRRVESSNIFCSLEIPREVPQCSAKSSRFQSPTVNRVFHVAAGTTWVGKKGLKTAGRVRASSKGMSLLTPTELFLLRWKFETKKLQRGEKLQVFANGQRRWNQSLVESRLSPPPVCSNVTYFLSVSSKCSTVVSILTRTSKERNRWGTRYFLDIFRQALTFY